MSTEIADAYIALTVKAPGIKGDIESEFGAAAGPLEKEGEKAGKKWGAGAKLAITAASAVLVAGVVKVFNVGLEELKFGEEINAQTEQLVKNTGFTMLTEQINDYTLALSRVSGISEEELQQAGNNILKFGDVSEDTYKRAVDSINDLGASGKEVSGVSEALGKALADPATAAALLKRQGVLLTDEQEALIDSFVEAGDKAGAQGVILDALEDTYGGMAEATGATLQGNINKLNNAFENLAGDVVASVMPAIQGFVEFLQGAIEWMADNPSVVTALAVAIGILTLAIIAANVAMWAMAANPIVLIVLAIVVAVGLLIAAIVWLILEWDAVVKWVTESFTAFNEFMSQKAEEFLAWWTELWGAVGQWITDVWEGFIGWIVDVWNGFMGWIKGVIDGFVSWWTGIWEGVGRFFSDLWRNFTAGVKLIFDGFNTWIRGIVGGFVSWWSGIWDGVGQVWEDIWSGIGDFVEGIWSGIVGYIKGYINTIIGLINGIIDGINGVAGAIGDVIGVSIRIPRIPKLADGGTITRSGSVIVGERGPELLHLPRGASVDPDIADRGGLRDGDRLVLVVEGTPLTAVVQRHTQAAGVSTQLSVMQGVR